MMNRARRATRGPCAGQQCRARAHQNESDGLPFHPRFQRAAVSAPGPRRKELRKEMPRIKRPASLLLAVAALAAFAAAAVAQEQSYTSETDDYTLELPSQVWKALPRTDGVRHHTEYVNGDRTDGYLRVRRGMLDGGTSLSEYVRNEA